MAGIKDLLSLHHWLGKEDKSPLKKALKNTRTLPLRKRKLLRDLEEENSSRSHSSDNRNNLQGPAPI